MFGFAHLESGDRDYFTDILNLAGATNNVYSLDTASRTFSRKYRKSKTPDFSAGITEYEITYCRDDVFATADAYTGMLQDVWKHPSTLMTRHAPIARPHYRKPITALWA